MKKYILLALINTAIFSTGCSSSIDKQSCSTSNWTEIGIQAAYDGKGENQLKQYANDCIRFHNIYITDTQILDYRRGYDKSVKEICSTNKIYELAAECKDIDMDFCSKNASAEDELRFIKNYLNGLKECQKRMEQNNQ